MIVIDQQTYTQPICSDMTVRELARAACGGDSGSDRRLVTAIRCDGRHVEDGSLDAVLDQRISQFTRLELETQSLGELVQDVLCQAQARMIEADQLRQEAAQLLEAGNDQGAMRALQNLIENWRTTQDSVVASSQAMGMSPETLIVEKCSLKELAVPTRERLISLKEAMQMRDFVALNDLLRFELAETLRDWQRFLAGFAQRIP